MKQLKFVLENCYGINRMIHSIDYSNNNVAIIYAPNGTMKSSLAKTFKDLHEGRQPQELIFGRTSSCSITDENNISISPNDIMVINPFDEVDCSDQGLLMANSDLRKQYISIHKNIDDKKAFLFEKLKSNLGFGKRNAFDSRSTMLRDWEYNPVEETECLQNIASYIGDASMDLSLSIEQIKYDELFNEKVIQMVKSGDTAKLLEKYEEHYNDIIDKSLYMQKGVIDHNNYGNICSTLSTNGFFEAKNNITLVAKDGSGSITVKSKDELDELIRKEKERVLNTDTLKSLFDQINKSLQKNKETQAFAVFLQKNPDLVVEYKDIDKFKKKVWVKAFSVVQSDVNDLLADIKKAEADLTKLNAAAKSESTDWSEALTHFKQRFFVPFDIETSNQEDVILKSEIPSFKYIFKDDHDSSEVTKENMLRVLSTGERRAYYILNMIFQVRVAQKSDNPQMLVLDDISESFDYRNKYAIIEYIKDISDAKTSTGEKAFNILLLTHNFDFYRTVASRITGRENAFIAFPTDHEIIFEKGQYIKTLFNVFKTKLNAPGSDNIIIASIPFVRNLIEYTEGVSNPDYLLLTSVLHNKNDSDTITIKQIEDVFNKYWCKSANVSFALGRENTKILDVLFYEANKVSDIERVAIENKLILSMALRQKVEMYIKGKIIKDIPNGSNLISGITRNQSGELKALYKQYFPSDDKLDLIEIVSMITPENIHLNSFMFEPIIDMSLHQLYVEYNKSCSLSV